MKKYKKHIIALCVTLLSAITLRGQNEQVFISEIMYDTPLNERIAQSIDYSNGEYIKISNVYKHAVDLSGWVLWGGGKTEKLTIEEGTVIPPQGHVLFAYQHKDKNTQQLFTLDQLYTGLLSAEPQLKIVYQRKIILSNAGESVVLKDNAGLTRDSIYYDGTSYPDKVNRLEATNPIGTDGYECFSLQRTQTDFDSRFCAKTDNSHWVKAKVNPSGFAFSYVLPVWEIDNCAASANYNYVKVRTFTSKDGKRYLDEVHYYDEMGRPVEKVQRQITPKKEDLAHFQEYDNLGRPSVTWLPVTSIGNGAFISKEQLAAKARTQYKDENPYSTNVYDNSPLENVVTVCGVGQNWHQNQKFIHQDRLVNNDSLYHCIRFAANTEGIYRAGSYEAGQLSVLRQENEDSLLIYEFRDKLGRIMLSRQICDSELHDTYYIYDSRQNLAYVLPPILTDSISEKLGDDDELMKQYAYVYKYDKRNRCSKKRLPGCDWLANVYDNADKLIFSQDAEQRKKGFCRFFLYDSFQRPALDGYCQMPSTTELDFIQHHSINVVPYYAKSATGITNVDSVLCNTFHYLLQGIQLRQLQAVSSNYYDNYDLLDHVHHKNLMSYDANETDFNTRWDWGQYADIGLLTARITGAFGEGIPSYSFFYYDYEKRPVQAKSVNEDGTDFQVIYNQYDYSGNPTCELSKYWSTASAATIIALPEVKERYVNTYDHAGRIVESKHKLNDDEEISLFRNEYDELGRLKSRTLRNDPNLTTEYGYNVRSWLNSIQNTHFKQQLYYEDIFKPFEYIQHISYSGNVSGMTWHLWKSDNEEYQNFPRGYTYTYDDKSQLTEATYGEGEYYAPDQAFFHSNYQYDKHGNMTSLYRMGNMRNPGDEGGTIDNLQLVYSGNQLKKVTDERYLNDFCPESEDFKDRADLPIEYQYNKNGAIVVDSNRGITHIDYNYLSLPESIEFDNGDVTGSIHYGYSADGTKLCTIHSIDSIQGNSSRFTTRYVGNKIYENGHLKRILLDEGYVEDGKYYFYLTDYLGNNRAVAGPDSIIQQMHYYPFGLSYAESVGMGVQPYKFGGKGYEKAAGLNIYDFSARCYEPDLGRFMTVDPMCEKTYSLSPYSYCTNNPINLIDPTGMSYDWFQSESGAVVWEDSQDASITIDGELFRNKGKSLSLQLMDGTYLNYFDNVIVSVSEGPVYTWNTVLNNERLSSDLLERNSPLSTSSQVGLLRGIMKKGQDAFLRDPRTQFVINSMMFVATGGLNVAPAAAKTVIQTEYTFTKSVAMHLREMVVHGGSAGQLRRPYMRSSMMVNEIMASGKGVADATFKGGKNWRVPGAFRGSTGIWELGINPKTNVIYHFNFTN